MTDPRATAPLSRLAVVLVIVMPVLMLAPFVEKPFHMDDPLYLWTAQQITQAPLDFYGFTVYWEDDVAQPAADVIKNPPAASYYIALVASVFGWSELALHIAFLIPAIALSLGTYLLARRFCDQPLFAAVASLCTPAFAVSATNVMAEIVVLCFYVWALVVWVEAVRTDNAKLFYAAAVLATLSMLSKYFGITLVPLFVVYALVEKKSLGHWTLALLIPLVALAGYEWLSVSSYGHGLLQGAVSFAGEMTAAGSTHTEKLISGLSFTGGCISVAFFFIPLLWPWRVVLGGGVLCFAAAGLLLTMDIVRYTTVRLDNGIRWEFVWQCALYLSAGAFVLLLTCVDLWKRRDNAALLLFLWVVGTFFFATLINWVVNARSVLPMAPAVGILIARRLSDYRPDLRLAPRVLPLCAALVFALAITWADYRLAQSARSAAQHFQQSLAERGAGVWYQGHWGFQYYMDAAGAKPVDIDDVHLALGDTIVVPAQNDILFPIDTQQFDDPLVFEIESCSWLATMNRNAGAGFYADGWGGPLPFAFGAIPDERYTAVVFKGGELIAVPNVPKSP